VETCVAGGVAKQSLSVTYLTLSLGCLHPSTVGSQSSSSDSHSSSTQYAHFSPSLHLQHVSSGSLGNVTFSADAINPDAHLSLLTGLQPLGVTLIASVPAAHSIIIIEDNYLNEHCSKIYFSNALVAFMSCGFSMTSDLPRVSAT
jgi:hypothetical protein